MSENSSLQIFDFENTQVRIVAIEGEPWFVAKDICEVLRITWGGDRVSHVPDEWKGVRSVRTPGGLQEMLCLSEQGLYFFLARSDKPAALPFQKKVAGEIIPSIRKHGVYMTPEKIEEVLFNPDNIIKMAQMLKTEQEKRQALEAEAAENAPLVLFAKSVETSNESILVGNLAKLLRQNDIQIGQRRMFEWLREKGYLMKQRGENWNMPTQRSLEMELFEVKKRVINCPDDNTIIKNTTKVTPKGQIYFVNLFLKQAA